jgi:secreted PhoX family phosphatase
MAAQPEDVARDAREILETGEAPERSLADCKGEYIRDVMARNLQRRAFLKGGVGAGAALTVAPALLKPEDAAAKGFGKDPGKRLSFETVPPGNNPDILVPPGYDYNVIIRWGDPLFPGAPDFDVDTQTPASQAQQFGFNNDLVLWYPLPLWVRSLVDRWGRLGPLADLVLGLRLPQLQKSPSRRALMAINHEYTTGEQMFRNYVGGDAGNSPDQAQQRLVEIEAHGLSVIEVARQPDGTTRFVKNSPFNRRITGSTPISIAGPLRGHDMLKTAADPRGVEVLGMFNNCAGGRTPWGTVLTCEENFDQYFGNNDANPDAASKALSERIAPPGGASGRRWEETDSRFDLSQNPREYNRFGYIVEIDLYDPAAKPKKRTALGRFKHEGASVGIAKSGQVVVYSGDDARFEYVYKFVSKGRYNALERARNGRLLNKGTLYVARFDVGTTPGDDKGNGVWLPLDIQDPISGPVLSAAGFTSQAEILLNTRGAADALGATPMDRPEDVEISPVDGRVVVTLTNNSRRSEPNEANPRVNNQHGHLIELFEDGNDLAATTFTWDILIKCGNPALPGNSDETSYGELSNEQALAAGVSPISDPDNIVWDDDGNLWISTDGQFFSGSAGFGQNDGVFVVPVAGRDRGVLRQFLSGVPGCEICGPEFSGDNRTFFCAPQHPHDVPGGAFAPLDAAGNPLPLWPIGETQISKPSLIAVRHLRGKKIGS